MSSPDCMGTRRQFLISTFGAAALAGGGSFAIGAPESAGEWACPLLGDLHFDRLEHHDFVWLQRDHPGDVRQVQNYSRLTREVMPKLLATVKQQVANAGVNVPMVLQLGDLIEGLCGTPELAGRQAREAIEFVQEAELGRPMLFVKGNHDITGPGAAEVYGKLLVPFMEHPTLDAIRSAAFTQERGGVLFVFYDAYDPKSLEWFEKLIGERKPERLVFLIHPPVVPYNARSTWHIHSRPNQAPQRERLLGLLGKHRAIVLCGHLHKYCFLRRRTEQGSFVQLAISSIATDMEGKPRDELSGLDQYNADLVRLEPNHAPETVEARRALLDAEKPFIEHFEYADTWGHALLKFRGMQIQAEVYRGLATTAWKAHDLTAHI
jgi:hypothetical protein